MLHYSGKFDDEKLVAALQGYLPFDGWGIDSYDIEYVDEHKQQVMVANFVWINEQWVYIDSRLK
jgi:hypothetical protein